MAKAEKDLQVKPQRIRELAGFLLRYSVRQEQVQLLVGQVVLVVKGMRGQYDHFQKVVQLLLSLSLRRKGMEILQI